MIKEDGILRASLSPPGLKRKAHQFIIENPPATWQQLKDHIDNKNLFSQLEVSSVEQLQVVFGNRIKKNQLKELTGLMKDHKINATYNPNEQRSKQNRTRFCKGYRRSGHTISVCSKY